MTFHILEIITPTDFHIFQRGWNHQPVSISFYFTDFVDYSNFVLLYVLFFCGFGKGARLKGRPLRVVWILCGWRLVAKKLMSYKKRYMIDRFIHFLRVQWCPDSNLFFDVRYWEETHLVKLVFTGQAPGLSFLSVQDPCFHGEWSCSTFPALIHPQFSRMWQAWWQIPKCESRLIKDLGT